MFFCGNYCYFTQSSKASKSRDCQDRRYCHTTFLMSDSDNKNKNIWTLSVGSNPACEAGTLHQASGVVSATCPGSLPWTDGCKVMVFKVPRIGDIWTRGCCGGIFPKCEDSSNHFAVGTRYTKQN